MPLGPKSLMPLSCQGLWEAEMTTPAAEAVGAGEVGDAGGGEHAGAGEAASGIAQAAGEGFGDPAGGFAGVLPENDPGVGGAAHQAGSAGASDGVDGGAVEGIFAGDAANAVGSKQLPDMGPGWNGQVSELPLSKMDFCAGDGDANGAGAGDVDERVGQIGPGVKGGLSGDSGDVHRIGEGVIDGIDVARRAGDGDRGRGRRSRIRCRIRAAGFRRCAA